MTRRSISTALTIPALMLLIGCGVDKSETPLSPTVAGPIAGVEITAPRLLEPGPNAKLKATQPVALIIENSSTNGVRPISYTFEVSNDPHFNVKAYARSGVLPGDDGQTRVTVGALETNRTFYWRVRAEDGANSSAYGEAIFEVLPRPALDPPPQLSPVNGQDAGSRRPQLVVGASPRNAAITAVTYEFQISGDPAFAGLVAAGMEGESGNTTAFTPGGDLNGSSTYYWRVRATDPEVTSPWSATQSFRTPSGGGSPGPGPAPGPAPGGPCNSSDPLRIVECERAKYGHMNSGEIVAFLRAVVDSLNRNGIPGGRFGLAIKPSGANCGGYSCDILCSGQGGGQRQWDVLSDSDGAQDPMWAELDRSHIQVRTCEIR